MADEQNPVLVLGAGINGVAIARELLLNGLSVCLVDRGDIAQGTTAYSSRLIHGGLRYLEYGDFQLVRESLAERERLLRLAPQFVKPLRLFIPIERRISGTWPAIRKFVGWPLPELGVPASRGSWLVKLGLQLYGWCAGSTSLPRHQVRQLARSDLLPVDRGRFRWLGSYYDAQILFPERFVVAMLQDARQLARDQSLTLDVFTYHVASRRGDRIALQPTDTAVEPNVTSSTPSVTASLTPSAIINATGAWVDQTLARLQVESPRLIGGTKGSHFLTRHPILREALSGSGVYAEAQDGRPVFLLPFGPFSLIGTTDLPYAESPESAVATEKELSYLRQAVRDVFPDIQLTPDDIVLHYSGVRPLPHMSPTTPAAISRRHLLHEHRDGPVPFISIVGGKLTTCRSLAEETAKLVLTRLGQGVRATSRDRIIPGGERYPASEQEVEAVQQEMARDLDVSTTQVAAVWQLCGTDTRSLLAALFEGLDSPLRRECLAGTDLPIPFVRHVIRDQWCCRLSDLVERRLMLLFAPGLSLQSLLKLGELMAQEGKIAVPQIDQEVRTCAHRLRSHFGRSL